MSTVGVIVTGASVAEKASVFLLEIRGEYGFAEIFMDFPGRPEPAPVEFVGRSGLIVDGGLEDMDEFTLELAVEYVACHRFGDEV